MAGPKLLYTDDPPFIDVALTLRGCGCGYMIVLAMYLNTLLMISINMKLEPSAKEEERQPLVKPSPRKEIKPVEEKKEVEKTPYEKYPEAKTQEEPSIEVNEPESPPLPLAKTAPTATSEREVEEKKKEVPSKEKVKGRDKTKTKETTSEKHYKGDKTLKSARMSIRLPRAPKGHHDEELEQMEKFLAEEDISAIEK